MTADSNENLSKFFFIYYFWAGGDVLIKQYYENIWQQTYMSIVPGFTFKLQSEIFNDKKSLSTKIFFSTITKNLNWEILTKNLLDSLQI